MNLRNKFNFSVTILILINIGLIVFGIYYLWIDINNSSSKLASQKGLSANIDSEIQNIEKFKKLYPTINPNLEKASDLLSNYEAPVEFMKFLEAVAYDCQLSTTVTALNQSKGQDKTSVWPFLPFQLKSLGSFTNFYKFLDKIESGPYLVEIQNLKIDRINEEKTQQADSDGLSVGDIEATILINLFTQKQ
ncbi:MAG: type 4a pilus biogenesis protein PilO [Patescibacteria group bacterium]|nr:type 4a pilus biogenesis protein PilO [Patescibacteria group bacterium]